MAIVLILFVPPGSSAGPRGRSGHGGRSDDDLMARMFVPIPIEREDNS